MLHGECEFDDEFVGRGAVKEHGVVVVGKGSLAFLWRGVGVGVDVHAGSPCPCGEFGNASVHVHGIGGGG